jgi:cytochrome P450
MKDVRRFLALYQTQCEARIKKQVEGVPSEDLFSSILRASSLEASEEKKISRTFAMNDLVAESGLLIVAGGDTTATGITATLFYLLCYTETFRRVRVRDKIDSAFERH